MRPHVAHDQITILFDLRLCGSNLAPRIIDFLEKIPQDMKPGPLCEDKIRVRKRLALNFPLLQREKSITVGTDLKQGEILVGNQAFLSGQIFDEEIGQRSEG